jgi:hypothetical protein
MSKITCSESTGNNDNTTSFMYSPVPYNVEISLYVLTKTQEDAMQIIEQILPTFTPEYTLKLNMIKDMNIIQDVPVILNNITVQDDYDGDFQTRRFVTHTLSFTLKTNLFGNINGSGIIGQVNVNVGANTATEQINQVYVVEGDVTTKILSQDGWTTEF